MCESLNNVYDNIFFFEDNDCYLNNIEREQCEGLLTAAEFLESLKTMESNKMPGTDGIPTTFTKFFGMTLSNDPHKKESGNGNA